MTTILTLNISPAWRLAVDDNVDVVKRGLATMRSTKRESVECSVLELLTSVKPTGVDISVDI